MRLIIEPKAADVGKYVAEYIVSRIVAYGPKPENPFVLGLPTGRRLGRVATGEHRAHTRPHACMRREMAWRTGAAARPCRRHAERRALRKDFARMGELRPGTAPLHEGAPGPPHATGQLVALWHMLLACPPCAAPLHEGCWSGAQYLSACARHTCPGHTVCTCALLLAPPKPLVNPHPSTPLPSTPLRSGYCPSTAPRFHRKHATAHLQMPD